MRGVLKYIILFERTLIKDNSMNRLLVILYLLLSWLGSFAQKKLDLTKIPSPIVMEGNDTIAYRDPAILFHNSRFYLFYTVIRIEQDSIWGYTAQSESDDLITWTPPKYITPRSQELNFSSPGNIVRYNDEWILCLQTYPRPNYTVNQMPRYGNGNSRIYIMRSKDLVKWSEPEILRVKGNMPIAQMGRMIDPYLIEDKDIPGKWWCFYKQNGVSMSYTYDFKNWEFVGHTDAGENVCVLTINDEYILFHSPKNGIGIKKTRDLIHWKDYGSLITLGQREWEWARGRITAGAVLDLTWMEGINKYLMFFHASGPLTEEEGDFDKNSSLGIAWSDDLLNWDWKH